MKSLRRDLVLSIVAGIFLLALGSGILTYFWARQSLFSQMDAVLIAKARALANLVEEEGDNHEIHFEFTDDNMPEFSSSKSDHYYQLWLPNGSLLAKSKSLDSHNIAPLPGTLENPDAQTQLLANGNQARIVGFEFDPLVEVDEIRYNRSGHGQKAAIVVARDIAELRGQLRNLLTIIAIVTLLLPAIAAFLVSFMVRRGLVPINQLAHRVGEINAANLKTQVTEGSNITELLPITTGINDLLARLDTAFERERRFTTDASHELRTPLAETRTALEIALKWPDDQQLLVGSARQALDATYQMEEMITALLALARAETRKDAGPLENINLRELVQQCQRQLQDFLNAKNIQIDVHGDAIATITTSKALLSAIAINLIRNAAQYSPTDSRVSINISRIPGKPQVIFSISNPMAQPLSSEDIKQVFEPLWRKDKSRTEVPEQTGVHFGLGLTLVKAYCEMLNVGIHASTQDNQFTIETVWPAP